jgi:hypothetical protein
VADASNTGYDVLRTLVPQSGPSATIMIAAQDMFFTSKSYANVAQMLGDFRQAMSKVNGMTIDREPTETEFRPPAPVLHRELRGARKPAAKSRARRGRSQIRVHSGAHNCRCRRWGEAHPRHTRDRRPAQKH